MDNSNQYNAFEPSAKKSSRSKWLVTGAVVGLLGLVALGVALGVTLSKHHVLSSSSSSGSGSSGSSSGGGGGGGGGVNGTNPNDPSQFPLDSALVRSFYGISYTPYGVQLPDCGATLDQVITDIQLLSQLTTRIHLYGADCNQTQFVLDAIQQTQVNMTVYVANYPIATDNGTAYERQAQELQEAIQIFGADQIVGMIVGNEFMLDYLDDNDATDPNSAVGNQGAAILDAYITDTRQLLSNMSLGHMPVGTAEAGAYFNNEVLESVNFAMANVHPWFANVTIDQAATWTWEFFEQTDVEQADSLSNRPAMSIGETGWPSNSTPGAESNGPSIASEPNLQTFLDTFVCQANANGTAYFFFEYFDEPWKTVDFGGVEGYWGLFYPNRTLKNIQIPNCPLS